MNTKQLIASPYYKRIKARIQRETPLRFSSIVAPLGQVTDKISGFLLSATEIEKLFDQHTDTLLLFIHKKHVIQTLPSHELTDIDIIEAAVEFFYLHHRTDELLSILRKNSIQNLAAYYKKLKTIYTEILSTPFTTPDPQTAYALSALVRFAVRQSSCNFFDQYSLYIQQDEETGLNPQASCYLDNSPDIDCNDEMVFPEFVRQNQLCLYTSGNLFYDVIQNLSLQHPDFSDADAVDALDYYLKNDTFKDFEP